MKNLTFLFLAVFVCIPLFSLGQGVSLSVPDGNMILISCIAGCILQEFIYWFELRHEIANGKIPVELNSKGYWILTIASVILFSAASYFYFIYGEGGSPNFITIALFAAGFPRLFKGAVSNVQPLQVNLTGPAAKSQPHFTEEAPSEKRSFNLKDYFMISR